MYNKEGGKLIREVVIYPGEDGYWIVKCPTLPGCISQGKTKEEAINNIREAIQGYINSLQEDGLPIPKEKFDPTRIYYSTKWSFKMVFL